MAADTRLAPIDAPQVLRLAYDEEKEALRVTATMSLGASEVVIDEADDSIRIGIGGTLVTGTTIGSNTGLDVNIINPIDVDLDHSSDSIRLGDGTNLTTTTTIGSSVGLDVNVINTTGADTPDIDNVSLPSAGTEYSYNIVSGTKKLSIRSRLKGKIQFAFMNGDSTTTFYTLNPGSTMTLDNLSLSTTRTIYVNSTKNADVLEIFYWV